VPKDLANVCGKQVLINRVVSVTLHEFVEQPLAISWAKIMQWRKVVAAPGREPVCPAQVKLAGGPENLVDGIEELIGFGQMFKDVGTDDEIVSAEGGDVILVEIDLAERGFGDFGQQKVSLIGKCDLAAALDQLTAEHAVPAAEIESTGIRIEVDSGLLDPAHGIIGLKFIKVSVILMLEVVRDELLYDHSGRPVY